MTRAWAVVLVSAGLLAVCAPAFAKDRGVRVGYIDVDDAYTGKACVKECLGLAGIKGTKLDLGGGFKPGRWDVIVIGSYVTSRKDARRFIARNEDKLRAFVKGGGALVVLAQAREDEAAPGWLPKGVVLERGERDCERVRFAAEDHPLLTRPHRIAVEELPGGEVQRGRGRFATSLLGATDLFRKAEGFNPVVVEDGPLPFPVLSVARVGKGLVVAAQLNPDKLCIMGGSDTDKAAGRKLIENLVRFAVEFRDLERPDPPRSFSVETAEQTVEVYLDLDRSGSRDPDEPPVPGAVVTHAYADHLTDADGRVSFPVDPAAPEIAFVRLPDGTMPVGRWYAAADGLNGPFSVGLREAQAPTDPLTVVQLSDAHIGREDPGEEGTLLTQLLGQLVPLAGPGGLFVLTGDSTHLGTAGMLDSLAAATAGLEQPVLYAVGNHDWGVGPDVGRLYERRIAPSEYAREWGGHLFISAATVNLDGRALAWFRETVARSEKPVVVVVHYLPKRKPFDKLDAGKVRAVFSGHWHGDAVAERNGIVSVNSPPALMGGWDFSPASARRVLLDRGGVVSAETVPFVRTEAAAVVATQAGQVVLSRTAPFSQAVPECVHLLDLAAVTPFSWSGTSRGGDPAAAAAWVREQCGLAALRSEPAGLPVRWAHPVPGRVLVAAPAVYGHKVLVPLRDIPTRARRGGVCALSDATGEEEWCHYTPTSVEADLRVVRGTLIVTEVTGDVWGVSPGDGAVLWTSRLDEAVESRFVHHLVHVGPIDDGGRAYYCFQGGPFGLDARDGRVVWQGEAYGGVDAFNHSRGVIVRDALYCAGFHGGIYRYDLHASTARKEQVVKGFRTLADLQVKGSVWALGRAELVRLDPDTWLADKLFSFDWLSLPAGPIVRDDFAIVPDGVTGVMRLPLPAGKREWRAATRTGAMAFALNEHEHGGTVGSPVLYGSRLFVAGVDGVLYELDVSTGEERRGLELGAPLAASPAVRADSLYVADWAGMVFAVDLAD